MVSTDSNYCDPSELANSVFLTTSFVIDVRPFQNLFSKAIIKALFL